MDYHEAFNFTQDICAELTGGIAVFPTSFDTTVRLRRLLESERSSLVEVAQLLQKDPLLAAKIVQAANSAALNRSGSRVVDLRAAVARLGLIMVRTMALSLAMRQFLAYREMTQFAHLTEPLIARSRAVAAAALVIAREHTRLSPDLAMFAGLIHDIGAPYLLYRLAGRKDQTLDDREVEHLVYHWSADVGRAVLGALDVPQEIREAIDAHHEPREIEVIEQLGDLLYVCKLLVGHRAGGGAAILDADEAEQIVCFDLYLATLDRCQDEVEAASALF